MAFAYEPFKWANSAQNNAGVSCTILGLRKRANKPKLIYSTSTKRLVSNVSPYLIDGSDIIVQAAPSKLHQLSDMITGNAAYDEGHLFLDEAEAVSLLQSFPDLACNIRPVSGTSEFIDGRLRFCLWFEDDDKDRALNHPGVGERVRSVLNYRINGGQVAATLTDRPHQFRYRNQCRRAQILVPQVSSERREYLPIGLLGPEYVITHLAHAIYDPSLVDFSVLSSQLHLAWISTICGKLETRLRYASNLGWNTFPLPPLTPTNRLDLEHCAKNILLAREANFPATIAELYDPDLMPENLRRAHDLNDETIERIYVGRQFRNDTERLEKLFELYIKMTKAETRKKPAKGAA